MNIHLTVFIYSRERSRWTGRFPAKSDVGLRYSPLIFSHFLPFRVNGVDSRQGGNDGDGAGLCRTGGGFRRLRGGFRGMRFWLWKIVVWTAFSHQTSCCLSGTVGFAHVQRMLSNTGIMVPSWKGGSVSKAAFRFGRCVRRRRYGEFPSPHPGGQALRGNDLSIRELNHLNWNAAKLRPVLAGPFHFPGWVK